MAAITFQPVALENESNYQNESDVLSVWNSIRRADGVTAATLFKTAAGHGWRMGGDKPQTRPATAPRKAVEPPHKPAKGNSASEVFARCEAATNSHGYITAKGAAGVPLDALRVVPKGDRLTIAGQSVSGYLVVPGMAFVARDLHDVLRELGTP